MRTRSTLIAIAALAAAGLAGCGDDNGTPTVSPGGSGSESGAGSAKSLVVKETDFKIDPKDLNVEEAGALTITVRNDGQATHALEIEGQGIEERSDDIAPGESATLSVTLKSGKYEWYCPIGGHKQLGMDGTVTVGSASSGGTTTDESGTTTEDDSGGGTTTEEDSGGEATTTTESDDGY